MYDTIPLFLFPLISLSPPYRLSLTSKLYDNLNVAAEPYRLSLTSKLYDNLNVAADNLNAASDHYC